MSRGTGHSDDDDDGRDELQAPKIESTVDRAIKVPVRPHPALQ